MGAGRPAKERCATKPRKYENRVVNFSSQMRAENSERSFCFFPFFAHGNNDDARCPMESVVLFWTSNYDVGRMRVLFQAIHQRGVKGSTRRVASMTMLRLAGVFQPGSSDDANPWYE